MHNACSGSTHLLSYYTVLDACACARETILRATADALGAHACHRMRSSTSHHPSPPSANAVRIAHTSIQTHACVRAAASAVLLRIAHPVRGPAPRVWRRALTSTAPTAPRVAQLYPPRQNHRPTQRHLAAPPTSRSVTAGRASRAGRHPGGALPTMRQPHRQRPAAVSGCANVRARASPTTAAPERPGVWASPMTAAP